MKRTSRKQEKKIENVIAELGLKKRWVAEQANITGMELTHILTGRRKTGAYAKKIAKVWEILNQLRSARL